ncbi:MAG: HAD-IIB family hydrolase [Bulleidia sp.]
MDLLACDFDGTVHFRDENGKGYFKEADLKAIREFQKQGNLFGLCTGRPLHGLDDEMEGGPCLDFVIASSGGIITRVADGAYQLLWEKTIDPESVEAVYRLSEKNGYEIYIHADGYAYTLDHRRPQYQTQIVVKDVEELKDAHITGISIWTPTEQTAAAFTETLNTEVSGIAAFQNRNWMDAVGRNVSKGSGIHHAMELFGAQKVISIGDSYNDIPMLKEADLSFTFVSSPQVVKDGADHVVKSVAEAIAVLNRKRK